MPIPATRLSSVNDAPIRPERAYVLYWMIAQRRTGWSFALDQAAARAREFGKPLVVLEALRCGYRWASDRLHRFVVEGMTDNAARLRRLGVPHYAYVEPALDAGAGLLESLAANACIVVTDEYPCFFLPRMVAAAGARLDVRVEAVDGNGLLPLRQPGKTFLRAVDLRRHLQNVLPGQLQDMPAADPLAGLASELPTFRGFPSAVTARWPNSTRSLAAGELPDLALLPIDHSIQAVAHTVGGSEAGDRRSERFLDARLGRYQDDRRNLDDRACSELSPYLHFGHIGSHQVLAAVAGRHDWHPGRMTGPARGSRLGWWGLPAGVEAFLDELVTWRELGLNMCSREAGYDRYESLPAWARTTIEEHRDDPRPEVYEFEDLEGARTRDEVWNAAQRELVVDGRIHNYLRMLWGKKIYEWSRTPQDALAAMIELNNKYALDGRDPNSYSGIFWCLGRYDRPWGPERPIFGKLRYMTSQQAKKKLDMRAYLQRYGPMASGGP